MREGLAASQARLHGQPGRLGAKKEIGDIGLIICYSHGLYYSPSWQGDFLVLGARQARVGRDVRGVLRLRGHSPCHTGPQDRVGTSSDLQLWA